MESLTMKNSKAEMIEAYDKALKIIKNLQSHKDDPKKIVEQKENERVIASANKIVDMDILNPTITSQYADLNKAIELKKAELKELFDIEIAANSLISLLNAHKDKEVELISKYEVKEAELKQKLADTEDETKREIEKAKSKLQEELAAIKKERTRNEEEYKYETDRAKLKDKNDWDESKAAREKKLAEKEAEIEAKRKEVENSALELSELKAQVEEFPTLLENARIEAATKKENELSKEYGYEKNLYEKEKQFEIKALTEKNARLESDLEKLSVAKKETEAKLDNAYSELRGLATETVKSTGGVKILSAEKDK